MIKKNKKWPLIRGLELLYENGRFFGGLSFENKKILVKRDTTDRSALMPTDNPTCNARRPP